MLQDAPQRIIAFYKEHRRLPSYREICLLTGVRSKQSAFRIVHRMIEAGLLIKDSAGKIRPGPAFFGIAVVGPVPAVFPSPTEEETHDTIDLDQYFAPHRERTFIFVVNGDSMEDAGIYEGDLAIVERGRTHHNGDIVVATLIGERTLKTYQKVGGQVRLEPANKKYKPIIPQGEDILIIEGVVVSVARKVQRIFGK